MRFRTLAVAVVVICSLFALLSLQAGAALAQTTDAADNQSVRVGERLHTGVLSPLMAYHPWEEHVNSVLMVPLLRYGLDRETNRVNYLPYLLERVPQEAGDGGIILEVDPRALWNDMDPVLAKDLVYTYRMIASQQITSSYHDIQLRNVVRGARCRSERRVEVFLQPGRRYIHPRQINVSPMRAPADFKCDDQSYAFNPKTYLVSGDSLLGDLAKTAFSGCYRFQPPNVSTKSELVFRRVRGCWDQSRSTLRKISLVINPMVSLLMRSLLEPMDKPTRIDILSELRGNQLYGLVKARTIESSPIRSNNFGALAFNFKSAANGELLQNPIFRKALAQAIDFTQALRESGLRNEFKSSLGPLPDSPRFPAANADLPDYVRKYPKEKVESLLNSLVSMSSRGQLACELSRDTESGKLLKNGSPLVLTLACPVGGVYESAFTNMATQIQADLRDQGITVVLKSINDLRTWANIIAESPEVDDKKVGQYDLILGVFSYGRAADFTWQFANRLAGLYGYQSAAWWGSVEDAIQKLHSGAMNRPGMWENQLMDINRMIASQLPMVFLGNLRLNIVWRQGLYLGPDRTAPFDHVSSWQFNR